MRGEKKMLIFDCEIKKAIGRNGEPLIQGIQYCEGWKDFENMGISCIGVYDYIQRRYRVFCEDNFKDFQALLEIRTPIVGFNNIGFDNPLCRANGIEIGDDASYDILREIWIGAGLEPEFQYPTHAGYGLDAVCKCNFFMNKTGYGGFAPVQWQRGEIGSVIDYCLNDVRITKRLFDYIMEYGYIRDPKNPEKILKIKKPEGIL